MSWRPVRTADGSWTLAHPVHGATCHSLSGAWQQARERYAIPCRLRELALERRVVRLLDVGTGIGLNLAAALEALDGTGAQLEALTIERDASVLTSALALRQSPENVERWYALVRTALASCLGPQSSRADLGGRGTVRLVSADAGESLGALARTELYDAVFFDPFAPSVEPRSWSAELVERVAERMAPHAILSTYSSSLAVRATLAGVGLVVGAGPRVGAKSSGTLASWSAVVPPLDPRAARRVEKRSGRAPLGKKSSQAE